MARRAAHPADGSGPFRIDFDYSYLDGPDVLVSDEQALVIDAVEDIVVSSEYRVGRLRTDDQELMARWSRRLNDVQHLPPITWPTMMRSSLATTTTS